MRRIPTCPFCGRIVLGLKGQDVVLDTFFLGGEDADRRLLRDGFYGDCHVFCLEQSGCGPIWGDRILKNFRDVRKLAVVEAAPPFHLLRNPNLPESVIISALGGYLVIADNELRGSVERDADRLFAVDGSFEALLTKENQESIGPAAMQQLSEAYRAEHQGSLKSLLEVLGIAAVLKDAGAIEDGAFAYKRQGRGAGRPDLVRIDMQYKCAIPGVLIRALGI